MAIKKIRNDYYLIDTKEDLNSLRENDMGAQVYVIKEAAEYQLMSTGEWVKQTPAVSSSTGGAEIDTSMFATKDELENAVNGIVVPSVEGLASVEFVEEAIASIEHPTTDLSGLATEAYVDEKVAAIEHPSVDLTGLASEAYVDEAIAAINAVPVMKMFAEDAEIMASNPGSQFGIALNKGDTRTLPEAMLEKGVGMYNFWIHKSNTSLPKEALAKKSSCRGICCVDTVKPTGWYGWALLIDQDGELYVQYIRNSVPQGWKSATTSTDYEAKIKACYRPIKYEITDTPEGTMVDYRDKEIRIYCPDSVKFEKQNVGEGGNANMYYMTFITYAPEGAAYLREGDRGAILEEVISLDGGTGCGIDEYGRKYKKHWFALASYDEATDTWTYFGKNSSVVKYIGWTYVVAWYDENNRMIDTDILRINLSNKDCHLVLENSYYDEESTIWAELPE